jgi:small GTP-binding protein
LFHNRCLDYFYFLLGSVVAVCANFPHLVHYIHTLDHFPEGRVLIIEEIVVYQVDKELAPSRIWACVGHGECTPVVVVMPGEFILDAVTRPPSAGPCGVPALDHEPCDYPVKDDAVVVPAFRKFLEIPCGDGHICKKLDDNGTHRGLEPNPVARRMCHFCHTIQWIESVSAPIKSDRRRSRRKNENVKTTLAYNSSMAGGKLKIVVFGSFNAGKSTFIQSIDSNSRHIEAQGGEGSTTVAFDFGRVMLHNMQIYLFGTPGQERFEFVREIISRGMDAAILVIDCTCQVDEFTRHLFQYLTEKNIPMAVMLNKCDMVEACPSMVRRTLGTTTTFDISSCDGESARQALSRFVDGLVGDL